MNGAQEPVSTSKMTPGIFRILLVGLFLVGSALPIVRGCNTSWNSLEVAGMINSEVPEHVVGWIIGGSFLYAITFIFAALSAFMKNEQKAALLMKIWANSLLFYLILVLLFVFQDGKTSRFFGLGFGWFVLLVTSIIAEFPVLIMSKLGIRTTADAKIDPLAAITRAAPYPNPAPFPPQVSNPYPVPGQVPPPQWPPVPPPPVQIPPMQTPPMPPPPPAG